MHAHVHVHACQHKFVVHRTDTLEIQPLSYMTYDGTTCYTVLLGQSASGERTHIYGQCCTVHILLRIAYDAYRYVRCKACRSLLGSISLCAVYLSSSFCYHLRRNEVTTLKLLKTLVSTIDLLSFPYHSTCFEAKRNKMAKISSPKAATGSKAKTPSTSSKMKAGASKNAVKALVPAKAAKDATVVKTPTSVQFTVNTTRTVTVSGGNVDSK